MKAKLEKPACPKCGKPMRHVSTGSLIRTYYCEGCKEIETIKRTDIEEAKI